MVRRNIGTVLIAAAVIGLLLIAFILSRAQHKLPELFLDLIVYLFATTLAVFVVELPTVNFSCWYVRVRRICSPTSSGMPVN